MAQMTSGVIPSLVMLRRAVSERDYMNAISTLELLHLGIGSAADKEQRAMPPYLLRTASGAGVAAPVLLD